MTGWGTRPISALAVAVLAAGLLTACGSSDSDSSSPSGSSGSPSSTQTSRDTGKDAGQGSSADGPGGGNEGSQSKQGEGSDDSGGPSPDVDPAPLKVSGGGSAQYRVAGGDNSVQEFGEEAGESELEEAAAALHGFLVARAEERWTAACSLLGKTVKDQLDVLASRDGGLEGKGCPAVLGALTPPVPAAILNETTVVDAGSLRFEDGRAFLIYKGAKGTSYAILMEQEDGSWKVGALSAFPLS